MSITRVHVLAVALCAVGFAIDLLEISLSNALSAVFSAAPYNMGTAQLSWLLAAVYIGAAIGAPLFGWAADVRGQRRLLIFTLLWLGVASLLSACAPGPGVLIVARFLAGLALGAFPPLMIAYLTGISPPERRGVLIFSVCAIAYLGPPAAIFLVRTLTPLQPFGIEAWRWPFGIAGVLAILVGLCSFRLPETPRAAATERPAFRMYADRRFLFVASMYVLHSWATVAFPLLTGPVLLQRGFGITDTLLYVGVATFGPVIGTLVTGFFVDRIERRTTLVLCATLMLAMLALFYSTAEPMLLMVAVVLFNLCVSLYSPAMTMYGAELFPTGVRASATATAWAMNRVGAALVPLILLPLLKNHGSGALIGIICGALVLTIVLVIAFGPRGTQGRAVA